MNTIVPLPSLSQKLKWEGPFASERCAMKPYLTPEEQADLVMKRGLVVDDLDACLEFFRANNYYRFSGYARYFQVAPERGDDTFRTGVSFSAICRVYDDDARLRALLLARLTEIELLLRTVLARVLARDYEAYRRYLDSDFYGSSGDHVRLACTRDIDRSRDRHILKYVEQGAGQEDGLQSLPIWSAVEAFSFGTLSKVIELGDSGELARKVAQELGVAKAGFAYRIRALVYLRNRCAHHSRLWHHSVIDAGPTPNNVRVKAKRLVGQFEPRSVADVIASLDDLYVRAGLGQPLMPEVFKLFSHSSHTWKGYTTPVSPRDHRP